MDYFVGGAMLVGGTTSAVGWGMVIGRAGLPPAHALVAWAVVAAPILLATARYSFSPASEAALALTTATLCLWWVPMRVACTLTGYGPGVDCLAVACTDGVERGGGARPSAAAANVDAPAAADADDGGPPVWRLEVANGRGGERERRVAFRVGVPPSITSRAAGGGGGGGAAPRPPRPTPDDGDAAEEEEVLLEYDAVEVAVPPGVLPAYVKETAIDMPVEEAPYLFAKIVAAVFSASTRA